MEKQNNNYDPLHETVPDPLRDAHFGHLSINPRMPHASAVRGSMFASQMQQRATLLNPDYPLQYTGAELDMSNYNYDVRVPEDCEIIEAIPLYTAGENSYFKRNSTTAVIYRSQESGEYGVINMETYHKQHGFLGFEFVPTKETTNVRKGQILKKDEILATTPSMASDGTYRLGKYLNYAITTSPHAAEDGIEFKEGVLDELKYTMISTSIISVEKNQIPKNIYGVDNKDYRVMPGIGERIREDGLLMNIMDWNPDIGALLLRPENMSGRDYFTDRPVVDSDWSEAEVVDIRVIRNKKDRIPITGATSQLDSYADALDVYYRKIVSVYYRIKKECVQKGYEPKLSPEFNVLIRNAMVHTDNRTKLNINKANLPAYHITITIKRVVGVMMGGKLTNMHAAKGVACRMTPEDEMMQDQNGVSADVIISYSAPTNRMIPSMNYEMYFNQASVETGKAIRGILGLNADMELGRVEFEVGKKIENNSGEVNRAIDYLLGFYRIISVETYDTFRKEISSENRSNVFITNTLASVCKYGAIFFGNIESLILRPSMDVYLELERSPYKPLHDRVWVTNHNGDRVLTKEKIRIAPCLTIVLERDGRELTATSTMTQQVGGLASILGANVAKSKPISTNNCAFIGVDESIQQEPIAPDVTAEMVDLNSSPKTHAVVTRTLLESSNPSNVDKLVDRTVYPYGQNQKIQMVKHILASVGDSLHYMPEKQEPYE